MGRFAPSPTGPLHFGSLIAAVASYLDARRHRGKWLLRIDDLDPPREVAGAADRIIADLQALGFVWDDDIVYQSRRQWAYDAALAELLARGLAFPCGCSRRELPRSGVYPGTCARGLPENKAPRSVRLRVPEGDHTWRDQVQGEQTVDLARSSGAFVIRRADGLTAYQLAVAVDDADAGVNHIVRGVDLADSTPRQMRVQECLGYARPAYAHVPVALDRLGRKLSKSTGAAPVDPSRPLALLTSAWRFLTGDDSRPNDASKVDDWWAWAIPRWSLARVPAVYGLAAERP